MKISILCVAVLATATFALTSCKYDDEPKDSKKEQKTFTELFGEFSKRHSWNMAKSSAVWVKMPPDNDRVKIYIEYGQTYWIVANRQITSDNEMIRFDIPVDIDDLLVVVGSCQYHAISGGEVDASRNDGEPARIIDLDFANRMRWIIAAELHEEPDYDFNDFVASVTPNDDDTYTITALAAGTDKPMWLHSYISEDEDYIISPSAQNGAFDDIRAFTQYNANNHQWASWFGVHTSEMMINTAATDGINKAKGASVTVPAAVLFGAVEPSMSEISISELSKNGKVTYAKPTSGLFITVGVHDTYYADDNLDNVIVTAWPGGCDPQLLVIPDISDVDTDFDYHGWRWPSEGTPINLPYPYFTRWLKSPSYPWCTMYPLGWGDSPAKQDKNGKYSVYGFYDR